MADTGDVILVVEDHADIREGIRTVLELEGYTVAVANNGADALWQMSAGLRPRLIVIDLMMPVMNGFEFREAQLANPELKDIPLIAYSAVTNPSETARQLEAAAYLHKPSDAEQLAALVRQFFSKSSPAQ